MLAIALYIPIAHAQSAIPGSFNKTTADKVLNYPFEAGRTGIVFHYNSCTDTSSTQIVIQTRTADFDLVGHYVNNNTVGLRAGSGNSQQAVARANYLELVSGRNDLPDGVLIVTVKACHLAPAAYTVTVATWHDQGESSDRPTSYFVRDTSASQDTGIAIHRSASTCRFTDVQLAANAPNWLELRKHRANGTADGAGGQRFTVRMEKDHADDRHVRVRFKDNASPAPGSHVFSIVMERTAASGAGCTAASAAAYTLGYTLNISLGAIWERERTLNSDSVSSYSADALGGSFALAMGPRIHRSSSLCRWTDASLVAGGSFLVLQRHATAGGVAVGAPAASVSDVRMQRGASGDQYLSLIYRRNTPVPAGTLTAAVELKPSARCASYAGIPGPLTLTFTATIGAAATNTEPWIIKTGFASSAPTITSFSPASIYSAIRYREIHTGIFIGRRTATCNDYSYNLLNHRALFEVGYYPSGRDYQDNIFPDDSLSRTASFFLGNNNGGFGLQFQIGANPVPNTTITLHVALGKHPACGNPTPTTLSYTMSFGPAAPWGTLANNVATVTALFRPTQLSTAASATDTGLRFNRGVATSVCTNLDVELASGNRTHLELQKYNGTTPDGAAAASFSGLTMHAGATGRPVGVQFKAGVSVAAGVLTVAVIARPASSCNHAAEPIPLTVTYELLVGERQLWQVHELDNMGRAVQLRLNPQLSSSDVGLRVHRNLSGCDSLDVSLPSSAPAYMMLQQYGPNGSTGSLARTQTAVPMKGTGAADDRHVRLVITPSSVPQADVRLTMSIEVSANAAACGTGNDIPTAQMASGVVLVARAEAWNTLAGDTATVTSLFRPAALRTASSATDTGLRLHRGTSACPQVDVEVQPAAFLELRKYNGSTPDGAAATSLSNVRMQTGHADDRRVGVQFKAGVNLPSSLFTATLVAEPVSGCTVATAPWPLTLTYELAVLDSWPWRAAAQDNLDTQAQLNNLALQGSGPRPTGLRVHRNSRDCSSTDVALASDSPAYMKLGKYQSNGTADGAAARSLTGVSMSGSGANDRHVRVTFDGGTDLAVDTTLMITLTINSSCTGQGHPPATQLVGTVAIVAANAWSALAGDVASLAQTVLFQPTAIRAATSATDTGLRLHRVTSVCPNVDVTLNTTTHLELRQYTSSAATGSAATFFNNIRMQAGHADDRRVGVQFRAGATLTAGRLTLTLEARANASCANRAQVNPLTVAYELEIRENWPWRTQGQDNLGTQARLPSVVLDTTGPAPTGLRVHRDSLACQSTDVALASGAPAYMKLRKYQSNGTANGSEARTQTGVNMSGSGANDRYVEITFDGGTEIAVDTTLMVTLTITPNSSCTGRGHPPATEVVGTVVVIEALPWLTLAGDVANRDRILFRPSEISSSGSATDTGLRFHRGTTVCPDIDVTLRNTAHLELRQYTSSAATGAAATFFRNVRMQANHANDRLVGVQFRAGATLTEGPFTLTLVAEANASCTNPAKQLPLTLAYTLSVQENWPLRSQGQDNLGTQARLPARSLSGATGAVPTGLRLHRNILVCSNFDVALAAGAPAYLKLGKYQTDGTADGAAARSLTGVAMPGSGATDRHVRVAIDGGTSFPALTTLRVTMTLSTNSSCASQSGAPASHELVGTVAVVPPDAWIELAGDVNERPDTLFRPARILASNAAIDTGLRFHRGTEACPDVDVTLNNTTHLELRQYTSSAATGAAATFFRNVRMQANHANDRRIGVQFRAGATVQAGQLTLTLVARAASGCASQNAPSPLTLAYTLAALERWPWSTQAQDSFAAPASVSLSALATTGAVPTGLRVHRNSPACSSVDVELAAGSPSYLSLQRHSAAGTADGAAARSLAAVNMAGTGASARHAQVMIAGGTTLTTGATVMVSLSIAPNASCSTAEGVQAQTDLVGSFLIAGRGEEEIAEESIQAGSAMAMRMMGLETIDAVLGRATAGSGAAATEQLLGMLAAKEAELESGDIDLREFLAGQSFELAATERRHGSTAGAAAWGRAAFFKTASTVSATTELESELFSAHFGADYRWDNGIVLGLGLGRNELEGNYKDESIDGNYQLDLDLYQPYAVIPLGPAGWLAAYGSQGSGEITLPAAENNATDTMHDADYIGWGLGWRNDLDALRMRASASGGELEAKLGEVPMDSKAGVVRLGVAYAPSFETIPLRPELEAAWSKDWGDAQVGQHWLLGLGLEYAGDGPLQARAAYQHAVAGDGDLAGLELDFRFLPGRGGLGPSFALRPGYGLATGAAVFDQVAQPFAFDGGDDGDRRLQAEMAWGLPVSGGVLTPYSDWSVDGESDKLGAGLRLGTGAAGAWQLGWQREDSSSLQLQLRIAD